MSGFRNREYMRMAGQEIQRDLSCRSPILFADRREQAPARTLWRRKVAMPKRCIANHRDLARRTIGQQASLDAAVAEMVEHLVRGQRFVAQRILGRRQLVQVEITYADQANCALAYELFHGAHG